MNEDGFLYYKDRVCVPNDDELKKFILAEAHSGFFAMHPGSTKMYQDLKTSYWWSGMKRDVLEFVTKCMVCQKVKVEHQCHTPTPYYRQVCRPLHETPQPLPLTTRKSCEAKPYCLLQSRIKNFFSKLVIL